MPMIASAEAVAVNRRRGQAADGVTFWHTLYLGTSRHNMKPGEQDPPREKLFPMAFLVEQDPGTTAHAHFHQQDQFQLVVNGRGTVGMHDAGPVTVHFTGAYTAYGPIKADAEQGIWYLTLRNGFDPGARFMEKPENRAALRRIPGRTHRESVAGPLPAASAPLETLLGPDPDGMGAWRYRIAPGAALTGPDPATGRGQYWVVVDGSMRRDGQDLPVRSCVFVEPHEAPFSATAGDDGLPHCLWALPGAVTAGTPVADVDMPCMGLALDRLPDGPRADVATPPLDVVGALNDRDYGQADRLAPLIAALDDPRLTAYGVRAGDGWACVALTLRVGDDVSIQYVATEAAQRGQGLASALLRTALADAQAAGATTATLQASPDGRPVYERLGFATVATLVATAR